MAKAKKIDFKNLSEEDKELLEGRWGEYSIQQWRELERTYATLASEYGDNISPRLDINLRDIAKWRFERDKAVRDGDTQSAKRLSDMIKATMDSEALRVGDEKRNAEKVQIDEIVYRLERRGMLRKGIMHLNGVIDYVQNDRGRFLMSRDAIDSMMLAMINATRFNNGLSEVVELPEDIAVQDKLGEFMESPAQNEKNVSLELGYDGRKRV